jgi:hypothetical protein
MVLPLNHIVLSLAVDSMLRTKTANKLSVFIRDGFEVLKLTRRAGGMTQNANASFSFMSFFPASELALE